MLANMYNSYKVKKLGAEVDFNTQIRSKIVVVFSQNGKNGHIHVVYLHVVQYACYRGLMPKCHAESFQ